MVAGFKVRKKNIKVRKSSSDEYISESIKYSARLDALSNVRDTIWASYKDLSNLAGGLIENEHRQRSKYDNAPVEGLGIDLDFEIGIFEAHKYDPKSKHHTEIYYSELDEDEKNLLRSQVHVLLEKYHAGELK